jgi:transposase
VNTIDQDAPLGRRKRRRYTDEFKAEVVAACQGPGVSVAAIALMHKLNANLLRRWLEKAESGATTTGSDVVAMKPSAAAPISPAFVPLQVSDVNSHQREIRVEVRRSQQSITVSWPTSDAAQCAAWLREWLK